MKFLIISFVLIVSLFSTTSAQSLTIYTDLEEAIQQASKQNKLILVVLTGENWCKPCIKMKKNVFDNEEFISYASNNLIVCSEPS